MTPVNEIGATLRRAHVFYGLDDRQLGDIEALAEVRRYHAGDVVMSIESPENDLLVVIEGELRVLNPKGEVLADLCPGATVGEVALVDHQPRCANVVAKVPTVVAVLSGRELWALLDARPDIATVILGNIGRVLASRLRSAIVR